MKILWDRLVSIVDEATVAQYRTAFSTVVQEANDFACSLLEVQGGTLASSRFGLPSFVATQSITLREVLRRVPASEMRPGDVFITNDPWIGTGQAMDITILSPIFRNGCLVAFAGSVAHSPDLGGAQRWNLSTDVFEEALAIPPLKLFNEGQRNQTLWELIAANSRMPDLTIGDLEAQLAATRVITTRLLELMTEYGLSDISQLVREIYGRSEAATRAAVAAIPDGVYECELESDGFPDPLMASERRLRDTEPILLHARVEVSGSDLTVDWAGSSEQRPGSFNSIWTFTTAYSLYALRLVLVPHFPNNAGFYKPLRIVCPEGTVVNARRPSACLSRHAVGHLVADVIYTALAPALPDAVFAQSGAAPSWDLLLMGEDRSGRLYHRLVIFNGGTGASSRVDGVTAAFPANTSNTPIEVLEQLLPVLCEEKAIIPGSAGMGRHRGGFGQRLTLRALQPFRYSLINSRVRFPARGLLGGGDGRPGRCLLDGREYPAGHDGEVRPGSRLVIETPGGGGLGPPAERDPELIAREVRDGVLSP